MQNNSAELNKLQSMLTAIMICAIIIGLAFLLTGCDVSNVPETPTAQQIDSGRAKLDSANQGKAVKLHAWQVCTEGITTDPPCPSCPQEPYDWSAEFIVHRDSVASIHMDIDHPAKCKPLGVFPDTTSISLEEIGSNSIIDSAWYQMDGNDSVRYWIVWRPVRLHPDSLAVIADSAKDEGRRGLTKRFSW